MTIVVESSVDQVLSLEKGEVIQPADVLADNGSKADDSATEQKAQEVKATESETREADEYDLTPEEREGLTKQMLKAIGKKHRMLKEAEEFAASQYNERQLAEKRAEQYEREVNRLKAQLNGGKQPEQVADDGKPNREAFESDEAYSDAVIDWRVDQRLKAQEADARKKAQEDRQREVLATAQSRIEAAIDLVPDYRETLESAEQNVPPHIAAYMQRSPLIAELGYYFAKNPTELSRLADLPADEALVDIGEIKSKLKPFAKVSEAKVETDATQASTNGAKPSTETGSTPSKPRAAAPIKPLGSGSTLQVDKDVADMNIREVITDYAKKRSPALMRRARH